MMQILTIFCVDQLKTTFTIPIALLSHQQLLI